MGSVVTGIGSALGAGKIMQGLGFGAKSPSVAPVPGVGKDLLEASKKYSQNFDAQAQAAQARQAAANSPALIAQLSQRALGQGPSLAEAQLRSATNRNLQQQLAAAASMRGRNPAAMQRQLLQQQGDAGRQLAEQSATARLQEQAQAQQQLAQQQALADQLAMNSNQQGFSASTLPGTLRYQGALQQMQAQNAANAAAAQNQNALTGALLGTAGTIGGALIGGPVGAGIGGSIGSSLGGGAGTGGVNAIHGSGQAFWDGGVIPAEASAMEKSLMYAKGGQVPGEAEARGDSPANDTVPVMLSPGEIVIPRSHATPAKAKKFVEQLMATGKSPVSNMPAAKLRPSNADNKHPGSNSQDMEEILHAYIARKKGKKA